MYVTFVCVQQEPGLTEHLSQNITRQGLTNYTLNFLRVSMLPAHYIVSVVASMLYVSLRDTPLKIGFSCLAGLKVCILGKVLQ